MDLRQRGAIGEPIAMIKTTADFSSIQKGQIKPKVVLTDAQVEEWTNGK